MRLRRKLYRIALVFSKSRYIVELEQDYFSLLGLPRNYLVDKKQIKSQARKLLQQYHPDRFSASTPEEKRLAAQLSAHINSAVRVIEDPVTRLQHLLTLSDINAQFENRTINDAQFLMQQMELRECFDEVMDNDGKGIDLLRDEVAELLSQLESGISSINFADQQAVKGRSDQLLADFAKLHFFVKLNAELTAAARSLV